MFDIYTLLASGTSPEEIADAFTKNLNEAQARLDAEKAAAHAAAEEAKRKAEAERLNAMVAKREQLNDIFNSVFTFISSYYPSFGVTTWDYKEVSALSDLTIALLDAEEAKPKFKAKSAIKTNDDVFADFFKSLGL